METNENTYSDLINTEPPVKEHSDDNKSRKYLGIYFIIVGFFAAVLNIIAALDYGNLSNFGSYTSIMMRLLEKLNLSVGYIISVHNVFIALMCLIAAVVVMLVYKRKKNSYLKILPACAALFIAGSIKSIINQDSFTVSLVTVILAIFVSVYTLKDSRKVYIAAFIGLLIVLLERELKASGLYSFPGRDAFDYIPSIYKRSLTGMFPYMIWIVLAIFGIFLLFNKNLNQAIEKTYQKPKKELSSTNACARLIIITGIYLFIINVLQTVISAIIFNYFINDNSKYGIEEIDIFYTIYNLILALGLIILSVSLTRKYRPASVSEARSFNFLYYSNLMIGIIILFNSILSLITKSVSNTNINTNTIIVFPILALVFYYLERKRNETAAVWLCGVVALLPLLRYFIAQGVNLLYKTVGGFIINIPFMLIFTYGIYIAIGIILLNESKKSTDR